MWQERCCVTKSITNAGTKIFLLVYRSMCTLVKKISYKTGDSAETPANACACTLN